MYSVYIAHKTYTANINMHENCRIEMFHKPLSQCFSELFETMQLQGNSPHVITRSNDIITTIHGRIMLMQEEKMHQMKDKQSAAMWSTPALTSTTSAGICTCNKIEMHECGKPFTIR